MAYKGKDETMAVRSVAAVRYHRHARLLRCQGHWSGISPYGHLRDLGAGSGDGGRWRYGARVLVGITPPMTLRDTTNFLLSVGVALTTQFSIPVDNTASHARQRLLTIFNVSDTVTLHLQSRVR